ncbi:MAG: hypothetical protein H6667_15185 [Ardenticatenaceae bacterium]|nr:hypothetical protein [Ardenticatenaceae bacterium]MCB9446274.1 hypothetical protein [Ardenticatenaceae bacterium]
MLQKFQIAIDPTLEIKEDDFIAAWNASPETLAAGRVAKSKTTRGTFSPELAELILQTAVTISSGVLTSLILDLIRHKYPLKKEPEILVLPQKDGTKLIVVKSKD